jgi:hypothetical protein
LGKPLQGARTISSAADLVAIALNSGNVVTGDRDGRVQFWSTATGELLPVAFQIGT